MQRVGDIPRLYASHLETSSFVAEFEFRYGIIPRVLGIEADIYRDVPDFGHAVLLAQLFNVSRFVEINICSYDVLVRYKFFNPSN
jgi:hypothetical protein